MLAAEEIVDQATGIGFDAVVCASGSALTHAGGWWACGRSAKRGSGARHLLGEKGTVRLDGKVTTGILGADAQWERWLAGVALSVSEGKGTFDQPGVDSGTVESTLTSVNPYVRCETSERALGLGAPGLRHGRHDDPRQHGRP